jgi:hypothetical protein
MTFTTFADAVHRRFVDMSLDELFVVDAPDLWEQYLAAFPDGANPIFRTRSEHDCSTCRHFVRNLGNVVTIKGGEVRSIWAEMDELPGPFDEVANVLDAVVEAAPLAGVFRSSDTQYGAATTRTLVDGQVETWHHFHAAVAPRHRSNDLGPARGDFLTTVQVFRRGLDDLSLDALTTVIDLIEQGALYRGEEHRRAVTDFRALQNRFERTGRNDVFVFANASHPAARFRNTVIGSLVMDLSDGMDLEAAVRSFESKVAPTNYRRPTALITPAMVTSAMKTITDLGIERSLQRRFAHLSDVSVNDVLWVDRSVRSIMRDGSLVDVLMSAATVRPTRTPTAGPITISAFMKEILPNATSIELLVKNAHVNNFVSLTTGQHQDVPPIFKWGNDVAWSYGGNVTDSIKEKVKRAGGNVTGRLRVSLSWFNTDDLDIHVIEPDGNHIYYVNKSGKLDVDMNAGGPTSREPVENITWAGRILDGNYQVSVNNYAQRETTNGGFVIETESDGMIENYRYEQIVSGQQTVPVGTMTVKDGAIVKFAPGKNIHGGSASKTVWNVPTETFVKVTSVMHSPNFWGTAEVGNRHYIFALDGCLNDQPARGIYNEFLLPSLAKHRKVFEVLGDRTKCPFDPDQVSGLGFSSTSGAAVTARVAIDGRQRLLAIQF